MAAAIAAILGLVFVLFPGLRPGDPPSELSGELTGISWQGPAGNNVEFGVTAHIKGYKGKQCDLGYDVYTSDGRLVGIGQHTVMHLTPDSQDDTGGGTVDVQTPTSPGTYYVQFVLFAPNGSQLDLGKSTEFTTY